MLLQFRTDPQVIVVRSVTLADSTVVHGLLPDPHTDFGEQVLSARVLLKIEGQSVRNLQWHNIFRRLGLQCRQRESPEVFMFEGLFQPMHLLVIFFIALLIFGPKKLPELGKGIGEGIRALKDSMSGSSDQGKTPLTPRAPT